MRRRTLDECSAFGHVVRMIAIRWAPPTIAGLTTLLACSDGAQRLGRYEVVRSDLPVDPIQAIELQPDGRMVLTALLGIQLVGQYRFRGDSLFARLQGDTADMLDGRLAGDTLFFGTGTRGRFVRVRTP